MRTFWISINRGVGVGLALQLLGESVGLGASNDPSCDENRLCRRLKLQGRDAYNTKKDYQAAIQLYQAAYQIVPDPRLFALEGRSQQKLGNPQQAMGLYQRAWPALRNTTDEPTLRLFIREAEAALAVTAAPSAEPSATSSTQTPSAPLAPSAQTPDVQRAGLPRWRLGLGLGLGGLSLGALFLGIGANIRNGQMGSGCSSSSGCAYDMTALFIPSYAVAAVLAVNATLILTVPVRRQTHETSVSSLAANQK